MSVATAKAVAPGVSVTWWEPLGIRKTESFIKTGRLRFVKIGARAVGVIEDELDVLIEELRRERDRSV